MMSFFKRSAISFAVLGMAGSVYAAAPVTNFTGAFIGVEGLNLRPMNGDLDYVTIIPLALNESFNTKAVRTSFNWDWRVYAGIKFTDRDDITVSWMQMRNSKHASVASIGPIDGVGLTSPRWFFPFPWGSVNSRVTFDLDDAYLVWGHSIHFNNPWVVRFGAGLEYAKLDSNLRVTSTDTVIGLFEQPVGFQGNSHLRGVGPRLELDMAYGLPCGFAIFGKTNAALLVSNRKTSLYPTVDIIGVDDDVLDFFNSGYETRHVVVPKFGARIGASYTHVWGQAGSEGVCRTTTLTADIGWQVESYIHAIERPRDGFIEGDTTLPRTRQSLEGTSFASTRVSNFANQGLFIGIQIGTDVV